MNNKPTYFEMPNFDTPPDSLVRLGQIIHDFENPVDVVSLPPSPGSSRHMPAIHTTKQKNWEFHKQRLVEGSVGVWTQFLASVLGTGGDISLLLEREKGDIFKFDELETSFIEPDLEYVRAAMASPEAIRFYQDNPRKPAFMVTGIKIARGAAIERLRQRRYGIEGNAGVNVASIAGLPATLGPKASAGNNTEISTRFSGSSDFIFAYRLRRIIKDRSQPISKTKTYVKGAMHSLEDQDDEAHRDDPSEHVEIQTALDIKGVSAQDFGLELRYANYTIAEVDDSDDPKDATARVLLKTSA